MELLQYWRDELDMSSDIEFTYNNKSCCICPDLGVLQVFVDDKEYYVKTYDELVNLKVNDTTLGNILRDEKSEMFIV